MMRNEQRKPLSDEYMDEKTHLIYCKVCSQARQAVVEIDNHAYIVPKQCECQQRSLDELGRLTAERIHAERVKELRARGLCNANYHKMTFANDDGADPETTRIAKAYVEKFDQCCATGQGLLLFGGIGTGKTFAAMSIANALIEKEIKVCATSLSRIVAMAQDFDNADDNFDNLMSNRVIVVDDLGTERGTDFANEQIYKFIDACNTNNIPLIITTNITPSNLQKVVDESTDPTFARIYSRILEKCFAVKVNKIKRRAENQSRNKAAMAKLLGVVK